MFQYKLHNLDSNDFHFCMNQHNMGHKRNTNNCKWQIHIIELVLLSPLYQYSYQNIHKSPAIICVFVDGSHSIRVMTDDLQDGQVIICGSGPTCGAIITETTERSVCQIVTFCIVVALF